jgi:hypothetical protein
LAAGWRVHVEIELRRGFPVIADVGEQSGDEAKEDLGFGKMRATRVRRLISSLTRSAALEVRRRRRCSFGRAKTVKLSGRFFSS